MFQAVDSQKLTILMIAGAVFAAAGLWLLLRPKPAHGTAKIELFGLKFESSSAGLLVFLIGAAFVAVPLFVPEKQRSAPAPAPGAEAAPQTDQAASTGSAASMLPADPEVVEVEPNDRIQDANQIAFGQTVAGEVRKDEIDWIAVLLPEDAPRDVAVRLRITGGSALWGNVFNASEERENILHVPSGAKTATVDRANQDRIYVRVSTGGGRAAYELLTLGASE